MTLEDFADQIPDFYDLRPSEKIPFFVYYLFEETGRPISAAQVSLCFEQLHIKPYSNISAFLSSGSRGKSQVFLKRSSGYVLLKKEKDRIVEFFGKSDHAIKASVSLRSLLDEIDDVDQNDFLSEAVKCFEIGAYRAAIIMTWNLTVDHLSKYILSKKSTEFNAVLAANTDRRVRIRSVSVIDDFSEIPEGKLIEFCRTARIISNDVRKILEEKLGVRNSCAHPSNIKVLESKAVEVIEDLVTNIVKKFKL